MHDIGTLENRPFTITLVRMHGESWEDYVERCHQTANAVANLGPKVPNTALVHNLDALHDVVQVGEHAYEIVTPGYQPKEETSSERDTHFANWAASVWDELHTLSTRKIDEADKERYEAMDKEILARAGYDLVSHARDILAPGEFVEIVSDFEVRPEQEEE